MDGRQRFLCDGTCFELTIKNFNEAINWAAVDGYLRRVCHYNWRTITQKHSEDGVDYLSIQTRAGHIPYFPVTCNKFSIEMAICVKNERLDRWEKCQGRFEVEDEELIGWKKFMRMDTILDPDSGFLTDDGSLMVQIEIRIDAFIGLKGNKMLNLFEPFAGSLPTAFEFIMFYPCKEMLLFHSRVLADQLANGKANRHNVVIFSGLVSSGSVLVFLQLIHGVKMEVSSGHILDLLYLAREYQVLTVRRQLEVKIKSCSDEEIHRIPISSHAGWMKKFLADEYHEDLRRVIATRNEPFSEEYNELNIRKREMLLAITRAPFSLDLDSGPSHIVGTSATGTELQRNDDNSDTDTPPPNAFSIFRFFSRTVKSITGC